MSSGRSARTWIGIAAVAGLIAYALLAHDGLRTGCEAPAVEAPLLDGGTFELAAQRGKVVVLDFWATWCPPCRKSLPALQRVHERFRDSPDVVVASVNTDYPADQQRVVPAFVKKNGYTFPVLMDDPRKVVSQAYRVTSIPTLVIIDREGKVHTVQSGLPTTQVDGLVKHLEALIEEALADSES
ncbi:MAG: TlpA family protein disulfide reductase [Myxococcales bacterium]|nr:TlpA family protein disulfide reductase [Myxococcales bacterium]